MAVLIALGNNNDLHGFYRFLAVAKGRRKEWIQAVKRQDWVQSKYSRICGDHQVSLQVAKTSAGLQLCAVAIKTFFTWASRVMLFMYCFTLSKPVDLKGHVDYVPTVFVYTNLALFVGR